MTTPSITILSNVPTHLQLESATEIVLGEAVVVIAKHEDGSIGIGNVVRRSSETPESARKKCLDHALKRIGQFRAWKAIDQGRQT